MSPYETLITDVHAATMAPGGEPYGAIRDAALGIAAGRIAWVGPAAALPAPPGELAERILPGGGAWVTPGLIDPHTHLVFGGNRADEFERRVSGATYEEIALEGGGILSTVRATRAASVAALAQSARGRLAGLVGEGVTTVEVKSGYGLDRETELAMLSVARELGGPAVDVVATFLGAHALPPEYRDRRAAYLDLVCDRLIPEVASAGLADAVDAFCESVAFTREECLRVFAAAARAGLPVKLHADQLADGGGAALAAEAGALSADHLEHASGEGVRAMARAGTVAVLLPGASYFLRSAVHPPVESFRRHGVPMALATDLNPGSSPALSLLLMLNLAATLFRLTPEEALAGVTRNAARALGLPDRGVLEAGKRADLALWDVASPAELSYWMGGNPLRMVFKDGVLRTPEEAASSVRGPHPARPA